MKKKILYLVGLSILSLIGFWYFYLRDARETRVMKQGKEIVKKIEDYKKENKKLPDSLSDIGFIEDANTELYLKYNKQDSIHFFVWVGISSEESKFYYSDSKKWEKGYRAMK